MNANWMNQLNRLVKLIASLTIAAVVVWRGDLHPATGSIVNATISLFFAISIAATGLLLTFNTDER